MLGTSTCQAAIRFVNKNLQAKAFMQCIFAILGSIDKYDRTEYNSSVCSPFCDPAANLVPAVSAVLSHNCPVSLLWQHSAVTHSAFGTLYAQIATNTCLAPLHVTGKSVNMFNQAALMQAASYTVTYTAQDAAGNAATATRTVRVVSPCVSPEHFCTATCRYAEHCCCSPALLGCATCQRSVSVCTQSTQSSTNV